MKKTKFLAFLAAFTLIFAACSNVNDEPNPDPDPNPTPTDGTGTKENPYTVSQVLQFYADNTQGTKKDVWVKGYIVAAPKEGDKATIESNDDIVFGTDGIRSTAVLIAVTTDVKDFAQCVAVKLNDTGNPSGLRSAVNLLDNPGNLHKEVIIKGNLARYFAIPGVRDITDYVFDGGGTTPGNSEVDLTGDTTTPVTSVNEDFSSVTNNKDISLENWKLFMVKGDRNWQGKVYQEEKYAQASAHNGGDADYEYWIVTPPVDVNGLTDKVLEFKTAQAYWQTTSSLKVFVLKNENGVTAKTEITGANIVKQSDPEHTFVPSGTIDLSSYSGTIYIGYQYIAKGGASNSTTFRVDDVVIK